MDTNTKPKQASVPWMELSVILVPLTIIALTCIIGFFVKPSADYPGSMMNGSLYRMDNSHMYIIDQNGSVIRDY